MLGCCYLGAPSQLARPDPGAQLAAGSRNAVLGGRGARFRGGGVSSTYCALRPRTWEVGRCVHARAVLPAIAPNLSHSSHIAETVQMKEGRDWQLAVFQQGRIAGGRGAHMIPRAGQLTSPPCEAPALICSADARFGGGSQSQVSANQPPQHSFYHALERRKTGPSSLQPALWLLETMASASCCELLFRGATGKAETGCFW